MKVNLTVDLNAAKIADMTDQLPINEFSRMKRLIEEKARLRFKLAVTRARREFRKSRLSRKDVQAALAEVRGNKR